MFLARIGSGLGQPIVDPDLELSEFLRVANGTDRGFGDMAWGKGGFFGNDLYVLEGLWPSRGRIYRVVDSNQDGVGEATVLATTGQTILNPTSLVFGDGGAFGTDLFIMDYPSTTSLRYVFRVSNSGPTPTVSRFSSSWFFNPLGIRIAPDNQRIMVNNTQYFTSQGAGPDATIFQVSSTGAISTWSDGSNNPNDLWDINNVPTMSPDGWFTFSNHSVNPGNKREIIQCKDLNGDGDAWDAGEIRVIVGLGAPVGQQAGFAYDALGRFYHSTGADIFRYKDLNGDLDYWDYDAADFDTGERERIVQGLSGNVLTMNVSPDGDLYAVVNESGGDSVLYRVSARPRLVIIRMNDSVTLQWAASAIGFSLQRTDSLTPGLVDWTDVPESPQEADGQKSVSKDASTGVGFFRLNKPGE